MSAFNDTTTKKGLIQSCERYCNLGDAGITGSSQKLLDFTNYINEGGNKIWEWIFRSNSGWIYDDSNQTDLPQAATDLVSGTAKYSIPASALSVRRVEIKDDNDLWRTIQPYSLENLDIAVDEFQKTSANPLTYRVIGSTIELKPAPNYNKTGGLKIYFDRAGVSFASTDTTAVPGFASIFHDLLSIYASIQWLKIKEPTSGTLSLLMQDWLKGEEAVKNFYMKNYKSKRMTLSRRQDNFR